MENEKVGINETKEALVAVNEIALHIVKLLKDGFQASDVVAFFDVLKNDPEFSAKLLAGFNGIGKVPAEIKDIDINEGMDLLMCQVGFVPKFLEALKK